VRIMSEENVPRELKKNNLNMRLNEIKKYASSSAFDDLLIMRNAYHDESKEFFKLD